MKKVLLFSLGALFVSCANAQWVYDNLPNGGGNCFVASDSSIYTSSSSAGIYVSKNNGSTWTDIGEGFPIQVTGNPPIGGYYGINALAVSDSNIFAGTPSGIFVWDGVNWILRDSGLTQTDIYCLCAIGPNIFAGTYWGVFLSANNGLNWTLSGLTNSHILSLAVSDSNIFAGAYDGLYISNNNGQSWAKSILTDISISSLAICGANIYAGTECSGVYLSTDNGSTWASVNTGLTTKCISALACNGSNVFAGLEGTTIPPGGAVFISTNMGGNWKMADFNNVDILSLSVNNSTVFLGISSDSSVWQSAIAEIAGIQDVSAQTAFKLYPNPTSSNFIIQTTGTGSQQLQLFDLTGKLLLLQSIQNNKTTIDISSFAAGVYLVSLKSTEGIATQKLVIAK